HASLVVFDPLQGFLPSSTKMNHMETVRPILSSLARTAHETMVSVLLIGHLNKGKQDNASYKFIGSIDWIASSRSVMMALHDTTNDRRILYQIKNSLAPMPPGMLYTLDSGLAWGEAVESSADAVLGGQSAATKQEVADWLGELLD